MNFNKPIIKILLSGLLLAGSHVLYADEGIHSASPQQPGMGIFLIVIILVLALLAMAIFLKVETDEIKKASDEGYEEAVQKKRFNNYINNMTENQISKLRQILQKKKGKNTGGTSLSGTKLTGLLLLFFSLLCSVPGFAQFSENGSEASKSGIFEQGGIIITVILILIPVLAGLFIMIVKVGRIFRNVRNKTNLKEAEQLAKYIDNLPGDEVSETLLKRQEQLAYKLRDTELSGNEAVEDKKGLISYSNEERGPAVVSAKKRAIKRPHIDPELSRLVLWFIITATFWLVFGTSVGEYLGIKFVSPDADHLSWLSFGRLRPVHTNSVFWGWASLGMLGLGYYTIPRVGNNKLFSYKLGWISLVCINLAVVIGSVSLMAGINNGGGEFREYIWPIMLLFIIPVLLTLYNFYKTVAMRKTREIYISNWYIIAALIFGATIMSVAYLPFWQNGMGETIVQGYYMHQGVGMWFMMFTLGLIYYYLPQQLNRPIYSYSLGILAFWTQILFYTLIGSHHFVFSPIPWWLQTVAIVGSVGMIIPVAAGTTNFLMTFKGGWFKLGSSYTLPFFLVGIIFYFTGSLQGTAEAFRSTNLIWHFTDFTVAHSHLTMYGIITFILWAGIYTVVPRLTGKEPPQILVGAHFWMALIGLMFYSVPLMIGGTLKGLMWMEGKPFIDSVVMMAPYWLWRAVGGSLMWMSHLVFAYNLYKMYSNPKIVDVREAAIEALESPEA